MALISAALGWLVDTIDRLLARLEAAFDAQRRFVANASHELRTPLTAARALLEMVMTDPHATVETYRTTCGQVLEESEQQEHLIASLLALAHSERGIDRCVLLDLSELVDGALRSYAPRTAELGLRLDTSLTPARLAGDRRLVERRVANLLENALRHNVPGGRVASPCDATVTTPTCWSPTPGRWSRRTRSSGCSSPFSDSAPSERDNGRDSVWACRSWPPSRAPTTPRLTSACPRWRPRRPRPVPGADRPEPSRLEPGMSEPDAQQEPPWPTVAAGRSRRAQRRRAAGSNLTDLAGGRLSIVAGARVETGAPRRMRCESVCGSGQRMSQ